jgi:hypothetical protein
MDISEFRGPPCQSPLATLGRFDDPYYLIVPEVFRHVVEGLV